MTEPPQNILVTRTDRLGDLVLALPAATALKQAFPDAKVFFLTSSYTTAVAALCPDIDGILTIGGPQPVTAQALALHRFDAAVMLYPRPGLAWMCLRAGIPIRIGTAYRFYSLLWNRRVPLHRRGVLRHEAELNLELLRPLGVENPAVEFRLHVPNDLQERRDVLLKSFGILPHDPYIVVHPGSGGSAGNWPLKRFGELAGRLVRGRGCRVLITGMLHETDLVAQTAQAGAGGVIPAAGCFTLPEFAAVLGRADLVIGNSSGPLHLARALGTAVLGIYPGGRQCGPVRWGPYGQPGAVLTPESETPAARHDTYEDRCAQLATISVERVLAHLERMAERPRRVSGPVRDSS